MSEILSKADFARRHHIDPSSLSYWIKREKLTAPALTPDGRIDVALALAQLATTMRPRMERVAAVSPEMERAATLSGFLCRIEAEFFPTIAGLALSATDRVRLARAWHTFRERESKPEITGNVTFPDLPD